MNYKSKKGVTMVSLVIYVVSFLIVAGIIGSITIFFYNNTSLVNTEVYSAAEYNKLNLYFVNESEEAGNSYESFEGDNGNLCTLKFSNGDVYTLDRSSGLLYYNKICLCEDVQNMDVSVSYTSGKEVVTVKISFTNKVYTTSYTMNG